MPPKLLNKDGVRKPKSTKKWEEEEIAKILQYMKDVIISGREIEVRFLLFLYNFVQTPNLIRNQTQKYSTSEC